MLNGRIKYGWKESDKFIANTTTTTVPGGMGKGDFYYEVEQTEYLPSTSRVVTSLVNFPYVNPVDAGIQRREGGGTGSTLRMVREDYGNGTYTTKIYEYNQSYQVSNAGQIVSINVVLDMQPTADTNELFVNFFILETINTATLAVIFKGSGEMVLYGRYGATGQFYQLPDIAVPGIDGANVYVSGVFGGFNGSSGTHSGVFFVTTGSNTTAYKVSGMYNISNRWYDVVFTQSGQTSIVTTSNSNLIGTTDTHPDGEANLVYWDNSSVKLMTYRPLTDTFDSPIVVYSGNIKAVCCAPDRIGIIATNNSAYVYYSGNPGSATLQCSSSNILEEIDSSYSPTGLVIDSSAAIVCLSNGSNVMLVSYQFIDTNIVYENSTALQTIDPKWTLPANLTIPRDMTTHPMINSTGILDSDQNWFLGVYRGYRTNRNTSKIPPALNLTNVAIRRLHIIWKRAIGGSWVTKYINI